MSLFGVLTDVPDSRIVHDPLVFNEVKVHAIGKGVFLTERKLLSCFLNNEGGDAFNILQEVHINTTLILWHFWPFFCCAEKKAILPAGREREREREF